MPREKRIYLQHDLGARNDPKLLRLQQAMSGQGKAIWWDLIEILWEGEGYAPFDPELISYNLRYCTADEVKQVITGFDLFGNDGERFWSNGVLARLGKERERMERRQRAGKAAADARWGNTPAEGRTAAETPGNSPQSPAPTSAPAVRPVIGESETVRRALMKCGPTSRSLLENYDGPASDLEEFIRVFHFERNVAHAWEEVAKFIKNYQPDGWCRRGSVIPVSDRITLARGWNIATPYDKVFTNPTPLSYLNQVFLRLQEKGDAERWRLIFEVANAEVKNVPGDTANIHFTYQLSQEAADLIERTHLALEGINIHYIIKTK